MGALRTWVLFLLGTAIAVVTVVALGEVVSPTVSSVLTGLLIVATGLGANFVATRQRRSRRADRADSIEHAHAQRAAAATFPLGLLVFTALGAFLVLQELYWSAALVYGATALSVVTYWLNDMWIRHRG